jgi:hypothetical protein
MRRGWTALGTGMIENGIYALVGYVMGYIALFRTDWVQEHALKMQRRYPNALASRIAERPWYPTFIRALGVFLLLSAAVFTLEIVFKAIR